jgi:hypothetical protein
MYRARTVDRKSDPLRRRPKSEGMAGEASPRAKTALGGVAEGAFDVGA